MVERNDETREIVIMVPLTVKQISEMLRALTVADLEAAEDIQAIERHNLDTGADEDVSYLHERRVMLGSIDSTLRAAVSASKTTDRVRY